MTDNNIIKALECCILKENCAEKSCELCPYEINYECRETMFQDAINLIKHLKHENEILEAKHNCLAHLSIKSDDLVNRQKAEIARLQKTQDDIDNFARDLCKERVLKGKAIADFEDLQEYIRKEKSEAIREFAEKLKQQAFECDIYLRFGKKHFAKAVAVVDIDRLVEEMTEGENGKETS